MALFGQDTPDPRVVAGGAALGDLITGGPAQRAQGAYVDQYKKNATAAEAMWQARDSRARAIAREGIRPDVVQRAMSGDPAALAELGSAALGTAASPNLSNVTGGYRDVADMEIKRQRQEALANGDVPSYNRLTALETDKAYQPTRIAGGVMMEDGAPLGDQVIPLPQTQAIIDQREATADRTRAATENDEAKADAYVDRQSRPPAARSGKSLSPGQVEAKMEWITAQATEHAKGGKSDGWVQAWMRNEAMKAGIEMDAPLGDAAAPAPKPAPKAPSVEVREGFVSFDDIPSAARSKLKEGVVTKFGNGQSWMLRKGQPVRVK